MEQELARLESLTVSLLQSHGTLTSREFMEMYNTVYRHCTETTVVFETRGVRVYERLQSALATFVDRLRGFTSLRTLHGQLSGFASALGLVAKAYSYLERYFIRISIERRDGHIQDVQTLGFAVLYRRYMERVLGQAKDIVFFEIGVSRSSKDYDFGRLAETVGLLRRMLFCNDESGEYDAIVRQYLDGFCRGMDFDGEINRVLKRVYLEIYVASKVFDPESSRLYRGIVAGVRGRFDDVLELLVHKMQRFERFKLYVKIVHFMEPEYMERVVERYKEVVRGKVAEAGSLGQLAAAYLRLRKQMQENLMDEAELVPYLHDEMQRHPGVSGRLGFEDEMGSIIDGVVSRGEGVEGELEALVVIASLMENREAVVCGITRDVQRRLLGGRGSLEREGRLVSLMEKHFGASNTRGMAIMYSNHVESQRRVFDVYGAPLLTETRFLTRGFYELGTSGESLPDALRSVWAAVAQPQMAQHPRGELVCCHSLSPMVFSMNGFNFRMGTDRVAVLLWLDSDRDAAELERRVGGLGFRKNLEHLLSNGLVGCASGVISLNRMFSQREYGYIRGKYKNRVWWMDAECNLVQREPGEGLSEVVDMFEVEALEAVPQPEAGSAESLDSVLEARVMRVLKREKRMRVESMVEAVQGEVGGDAEAVMAAVGRLAEKEYCRVSGEWAAYVP